MTDVPEGMAPARASVAPISLSQALVLLWAALLPLADFRIFGGIAAADITLVAAAVITIAREIAVRGGRVRFGLATMAGVSALTFIIAGLTAYSSVDWRGSTYTLIFGASLTWCVIWIARCLAGDVRAVRLVAYGYCLGSTVLAISVWVSGSAAINGRAVGLGGHPVGVGNVIATAIALLLFLPMRNRVTHVIKWIDLFLLASAFFASVTLTGVIAVVIATAVGLTLDRRFLRVKALTATAIFLLLGVILTNTSSGEAIVAKFSTSFGLSTTSIVTVYGQSTTVEQRVESIQAGLTRISDNPWLGHGFDAAGVLSLGNLSPHDVIVLGWQSGGALLGTAILVFLATSIGMFAYCLLKRVATFPEDVALICAASAGWVAALSGPALFQRSWTFPTLAGLFALLAAVNRTRAHQAHSTFVAVTKAPL